MNKEIKESMMKQAHPLWHHRMEMWFEQPWWKTIWATILRDIRELSPVPGKIFRTLSMSPEDIRVVIIGQDPYPDVQHAQGIAFSSPNMTVSLREIFKEIARTEGRLRHESLLDDWHRQGVFLINTTLTTRRGASNAHSLCGWHNVTLDILRFIDETCVQKVAFVGWGSHAKATIRSSISIKPREHRLFLEHTHPAARQQEFSGNNHFRLINEFLDNPIDWVGKQSTIND